MTTIYEENVSDYFHSAYANIGYIADDIWVCNSHIDLYKKANKELWTRLNYNEQIFFEASPNEDFEIYKPSSDFSQTVKNVIPNSRLARYGDFPYDTNREQLYTPDNTPAEYVPIVFFDENDRHEPWTLPEVEEEFKRLTFVSSSRWCSSSPTLLENEDIASIYAKYNVDYTWLTSVPWPKVLLKRYLDLPRTLQDPNKSVFSNIIDLHYSSCFSANTGPTTFYTKPIQKKMADYPLPRYFVNSNEELQLCIIHTSPTLQQIWDRPIRSLSSVGHSTKSLNAEVPEFQPTKKRNDFPPFYDFNYESDLFPYADTTFPPNILVPISCNMTCMPDAIGHMIPVYQRPPEFYFRTENMANKKRTVGADLNNLIFLTQDEGLTYSGFQPQPVDSFQILQAAGQRLRDNFPHLPRHSGRTRSSNRESCQDVLDQVGKWLNRVYPMRSSNFNDISSTSDKMEKLASKVKNNYFPIQIPVQMNLLVTQPSTIQEKPQTRRRLYRDVLTNGGSCNEIEHKFEELEREALEQYAGSDTSLIGTSSIDYTLSEENMDSRRYQDLEREAVEQYEANGNSGLDLSINIRHHSDSMNVDMIPVVRAPFPSPSSSTERDSCFSQHSGNSLVDLSPRQISDSSQYSNTDRTQVFPESWHHKLINYNPKSPTWMKKKKKKIEKKKKTRQKKKADSEHR